MKRAILSGFIFIFIVALLICGISSAAIFSIKQTEAKKEELSRIVRIISQQFDPTQDQNSQAHAFAAAMDGVRLTIIDANGYVTGDSEVDYTTLDNHAGRIEIMEAVGAKAAVSIRKSSTLEKRLMYAVIKTSDGYYIRLAEEYDGIAAGLISFLPAVSLAAFLSLFVALMLAGRFSNSVAEPIALMNHSLIGVKDGTITLNPNEYPYEELRDMAKKINILSGDIGLHIGKLQEEKDKIDFILDNMKEGFILLDNKQNILLINKSACAYMQCGKEIIGQNIFHCTQNFDFLQAVDNIQSNDARSSMDMDADGRVLEIEFTGITGRYGMSGGLIMTMTDVTERRNAIKTRRDFFSNASHELKTPITSIKGSVELLCADIPLDEHQRKELLVRIGLETERMHSLINDIIMINRMESRESAGDKEDIDLALIIRECCGEIMPLAEQNGLSVNVDLVSATLYASRKNLHELVGNLAINAVKYNRPGGNVDISLKSSEKEIILIVRNDGEFIQPRHQRRIFERFYRIDTGRSKAVGGTGLGLSIVKHVVDSLGGAIRLESNEERGTAFIVKIPR